MLGLPLPVVDVPWFWTDQCGLNIQFAGDMQAPEWGVRGELAQGQAVLFGLNDGVADRRDYCQPGPGNAQRQAVDCQAGAATPRCVARPGAQPAQPGAPDRMTRRQPTPYNTTDRP